MTPLTLNPYTLNSTPTNLKNKNSTPYAFDPEEIPVRACCGQAAESTSPALLMSKNLGRPLGGFRVWGLGFRVWGLGFRV